MNWKRIIKNEFVLPNYLIIGKNLVPGLLKFLKFSPTSGLCVMVFGVLRFGVNFGRFLAFCVWRDFPILARQTPEIYTPNDGISIK